MALDKLCPIRSPETNVASSERGFSINLVGHLFKNDVSDAVFKLVRCTKGDCTAGRLVALDYATIAAVTAGDPLYRCIDVVLCPASGFPLGVAKCTFVSASFGLIQVSGINVSAVAGITLPVAGSPVAAAATAGSCMLPDLTTASHAARLIGICVTAPAASGDAFAIFVKGIL